MQELKSIIAKNISELRRANDITQADLADKLNYSDKAVSKWERGESVPDVGVLKNIADMFGVTVDYLLNEDHEEPKETVETAKKQIKYNHAIITAMSVFLVLLIATFVFVIFSMAVPAVWNWLTYVYAVPISLVILLIFNSVWFNPRYNFPIISCLMWSFIAMIFLTFIIFGVNVSPLFIVGIPGQIIIIMWSRLRYKPKKQSGKKRMTPEPEE